MTTTKIVKAINIDIKKFKLSDSIKQNKYQGKSVFASYDNSTFRVQLPIMELPFGISKYEAPDTGEIKYSLDLSLKGVDPKVLKVFNEIEESVLDFAEKNSKELFKKQQSKTILKEFYKSFIKHYEEDGEISDKYPSRFKAKLWTTGNDFSVDVYNAEKVDGKYPKIQMNVENGDSVLSPRSKCEAILQCSGLWVVGKTFGISWSVIQLKAYTNENTISGYAFQDDEVEEDEELNTDSLDLEFDETDLQEDVVIKNEEEQAPVKRVRRKKEEF
jgi:hypothetical protein